MANIEKIVLQAKEIAHLRSSYLTAMDKENQLRQEDIKPHFCFAKKLDTMVFSHPHTTLWSSFKIETKH